MKTATKPKIVVFYDGACPGCVRDRAWYEKHAGQGVQVEWLDITGRDDELRALDIDPRAALLELHVQDEHGRVLRALPAYQLLLSRLPGYRWLAWLIGLPLIRSTLSWLYRHWVRRRLAREGRL
ncbi:thiol-disulfide oxidoreductase DCC family protein [Alkalimonas amylolytica]|uniref:Predicted thiol-disulfide oxidoreductase YuxK, DCC family n=1 Tax=Alkalimonas amylolytica TaxID=152573 RepID=A0A1H4CLC5_ALKAM|nr:DUF393 domain-containing protein [Alkalimonas amylolytica]SEA60862.1 Predicted thiol-disulfide oxidoreductase YuxK, DCC family [Alkalimonas amylolytica]